MSFLPAALNPYASTPLPASAAPASPAYKPASLSFFTIFAPALRPKAAGSEDALADAAQILFYTSRERTVTQDRMLRQIGIAKGLVEFGAMVTDARSGSGQQQRQQLKSSSFKARSWNVHSSKRRLVLIEVQQGLWIHASIDLPSTARRSLASNATDTNAARPPKKESRDYHDAWLSDDWIEECIRSAWRDWRLLNGPPSRILRGENGRKALERALEIYFSVWTWSWNLESSVQASTSEIKELDQSVFTESIGGISVVPGAPRSKLVRLLDGFAAKHLAADGDGAAEAPDGGGLRSEEGRKNREMVILSDTLVLWPPTDAGCFDAITAEGDEESGGGAGGASSFLDAQDRVDILKRVISHLTGLERERALIRAAAAAGVGDSKRKGATGAVRDKSSKSRQATSTALKIKTASPKLKATKEESGASTPSSLQDTGKWAAWGGVFANIGKGLNFKGSDAASDRSVRSEPGSPKTQPAQRSVSHTERSATKNKSGLSSSSSVADSAAEEPVQQIAQGVERNNVASPVKVDETGPSDQKEAAGPFQALQQRLADAIPIQDAGRMWNGAESAWKGLGASLGLSSNNGTTGAALADVKDQDATEVDDDHASQAPGPSVDTDTDAHAAEIDRRDSITQPDVDVDELAAALDDGMGSLRPKLATREPSTATVRAHDADAGKKGDADVSFTSIDDVFKAPHSMATDDGAEARDEADRSEDMTRSPSASTAASTTESSKAFPSISVTSAAWYGSKALQSRPTAATALAPSSDTGGAVSKGGAASDSNEATGQDSTQAAKTSSAAGLAGGRAQEELASIHHDFELDGWGEEAPTPFQSFRCFLRGSNAELTADSESAMDGADDEGDDAEELEVSFTTRRLLTIVFIDRLDAQQRRGSVTSLRTSSSGGVSSTRLDPLLAPSWELLRRVQRMLSDYERAQKAKQAAEDERPSRFLHLDGPTLTVHNRLHDESAQKLDEETEACALGHCLAAKSVIERHGVRETFARSNNGRTWVATRLSQPAAAATTTATAAAALTPAASSTSTTMRGRNATYMLMGGRSVSIVDCDNELRRVANEFPSFGI